MRVAVIVRFQRAKDLPWETGVTVLQETGVHSINSIIDDQGKAVDEIHDFSVCYIYGCMGLPPVDTWRKK